MLCGEIMQNLISYALALIIVAVALMIGTGIVAQTFSTVNTTVGGDSTLTSVNTDIGTALTTFGGFLPVVIIAGIGAIALGMIMTFGRR